MFKYGRKTRWSRDSGALGISGSLTCVFHSQEDHTLKDGLVVEAGTGFIVLTRAAGVSDEFFTRGKEFVPERQVSGAAPCSIDTFGLVLSALCTHLRFCLLTSSEGTLL